uniref:ATP synthase F0 subunit 8 n=1 Tax=Laetmonice producta TaxID=2153329 RepID=A0A343W6E5_9ANNE|nr:ATP synthase F0 subunit 8 [Laetmonice producta]
MPHLSPLNWIITPITFWVLIMSFSSLMWWMQTPFIPNMFKDNTNMKHNQWKW